MKESVWGQNLLESLGIQAVNVGVASLVILFIAGIVTFTFAAKANRKSGTINSSNVHE